MPNVLALRTSIMSFFQCRMLCYHIRVESVEEFFQSRRSSREKWPQTKRRDGGWGGVDHKPPAQKPHQSRSLCHRRDLSKTEKRVVTNFHVHHSRFKIKLPQPQSNALITKLEDWGNINCFITPNSESDSYQTKTITWTHFSTKFTTFKCFH